MSEETIMCYIESPKEEYTRYENVVIRGWAISSVSEVEIKITVNGETQEVKRTTRADVAKEKPEFGDNALNSGFESVIKIDLKKRNMILIKITDASHSRTIRKYVMGETYFVKNNNNRARNAASIVVALSKKLLKGQFPKNTNQIKNCVYSVIDSLKNEPTQNKNDPFQIWRERNNNNSTEITSEYNKKPLISIVMPAYNTKNELLTEAIESVLSQSYTNWELIIVDDHSQTDNVKTTSEYYSSKDSRIKYYRLPVNSHISIATNYGVSKMNGEFIFLMDHDDLITSNALLEVIKAINENDGIDIIYSDDDKISEDGNKYFDPQFKPDFSPELLLSYMYISHIFVIRKSLYEAVGGCREGYEGSQDYDLMLRLSELTNNIHHIPKILYHWRATETSTANSAATKPYSIINGEKAVNDAIMRRKLPVEVIQPEYTKNVMNLFKLKYKSDNNPKISIIIPSKNHKDDLKRCIDSIVNKSTYDNYEIIIVDNNSDDEKTIQYLSSINHKIIKCDNIDGHFNFSHNVNVGVDNSNGDYIVLLNNDTEIITDTWMEELLAYATIPGVGAVGARLLYPDNTIQHAGVVMKMETGIAGHCFKTHQSTELGYMMFSKVAKNYSAVTAACLMSKREIFENVGKFDEIMFSVSFNDVDYCLKLIDNGYRVVYNGNVELYHFEGKSRGVESTGYCSNSVEEYNLITKWKINDEYHDPYYNINLDLKSGSFNVNNQFVHPVNHGRLCIALFTHNLNYEGAPLMQYTISKYLTDKYNFIVISPIDGKLKEKYTEAGIPVFIKAITTDSVLNKDEKYAAFADYILNEIKPDLAYVNTIENYHVLKLLNDFNIPTIWGIHESVNYECYFAGKLDKKITKDLFSNTTRLAFVSEVTKNLYSKLENDNYVTIKNGVNVDELVNYKNNFDKRTMMKKMGFSEDETIIVITGTVCERKGQRVLVDSIISLLKKGYKIKCIIAGSDHTDYAQNLKKTIEKMDLLDKIMMTGVCEDIYQYYSVADIFVCASFEESSPSVILEAMAFQTPIVSTNVHGIPELIRNNQDALLCKPGNSKVMATLIEELLNDTEKSKRISHNAFYRVKTFFTTDNMINGYKQLFETVYSEGLSKTNSNNTKNDS